jgi:rare lipoprotein A
MTKGLSFVIPAQAGIQTARSASLESFRKRGWIPAFAGMTPMVMLALCFLLTACGSGGWTPPVYSGHEESTEGVPGFENGQKKSPYVKLGQSYKVMGEWYVPRFQPDYDETGLASWYGPGFHGGKTANGEKFDKHSMTAAHKTLPLPSIVKVTMVETGKTAYVRINDRGPFAKGRIIDLSYGAAQAIGLIAKGTAKVRVQYMLPESQRFADLIAQGREPESIDIASEVLPYAQSNMQVAEAEIHQKANRPVSDKSWWDDVNPIGTAHAATPPRPLYEDSEPNAAPTDEVATRDLTPQTNYYMAPPIIKPVTPISPNSPFAAMVPPQANAPPKAPDPPKTSSVNAMYVQLGSFSKQENAVAMTQKVADIGAASMTITQRPDNTQLYRVRLGPYEDTEMAEDVLDRVHALGLAEARFARE